MILVAPDTSPRNTGIEGEDNDWDFALALAFTWMPLLSLGDRIYQMYSYVVRELPALIAEHFLCNQSTGHLWSFYGGHGALVCALRNPDRQVSFSFCTIAAPMRCPWGQKAFTHLPAMTRKTMCLMQAF